MNILVPTNGKKLFLIDASLLKVSDCDYQVHLTHNEGLTSIYDTYKMDYGTAFHKFLAGYYSGKPIAECMQQAVDYYLPKTLQLPESEFRTVTHLIKSMGAYADYYGNGGDLIQTKWIELKNGTKEPLVEIPFAVPFKVTDYCEVILTGTQDLECTFAGVEDVIVDHKSTAVQVYKADDYLASYDTDIQGKFYSWINKTYRGLAHYQPVVINGIFISKEREERDTTKARKLLSKSHTAKQSSFIGVEFRRSPSPIYFSDDSMARFEQWVFRRVDRILGNYIDNRWEENYTRCDTKFGSCPFAKLCKLDRKERDQLVSGVPNGFKRRVYNPLEFQA